MVGVVDWVCAPAVPQASTPQRVREPDQRRDRRGHHHDRSDRAPAHLDRAQQLGERQRPAQRLHTIGQAQHPGAPLGVGAPVAVVADREVQDLVAHLEAHVRDWVGARTAEEVFREFRRVDAAIALHTRKDRVWAERRNHLHDPLGRDVDDVAGIIVDRGRDVGSHGRPHSGFAPHASGRQSIWRSDAYRQHPRLEADLRR